MSDDELRKLAEAALPKNCPKSIRVTKWADALEVLTDEERAFAESVSPRVLLALLDRLDKAESRRAHE
jgi:hypothetical protein